MRGAPLGYAEGMWALLATTLLSAAPERATFLFELSGVPVGAVELLLEPEEGAYTYRSRQLFTRGGHSGEVERKESLVLRDGRRLAGSEAQPEGLWLWRRPPPGCVAGRQELTGKEGPLCADAVGPAQVRGSVMGEPFLARYGGDGRLLTLELRDARFIRVEEAKLPAPPDLFASGFPVFGEGEVLAVEPLSGVEAESPALPERRARFTEREARGLAQSVHRSFTERRPSAADLSGDGGGSEVGSCLAHAERFLARAREQGRAAELVLGLLAEGDRAYPHAWLRVWLSDGARLELDPTSLAPVARSTHLALGDAGGTLLDLMAGRARVSRAVRTPSD